jgi:DNA ligase-1
MSEKMDGVRAYWNGHKLISRQNKPYNCPSWFTEGLPREFSLDGELWMGKGTWEILLANLNASGTTDWKKIKYLIFDLPASQEPYESRLENLKKLDLPSHVSLVNSERCQGKDHLQFHLDRIVREGGEGLILRDSHSPYTSGRSSALLKVKVFLSI